ncbi:MAG: hypothetical protein A2015_16820 [Spirochaetes bacterium GWF1_31_7]|nr:MAG: hypothetical protein A2Y30_14185 [Spirochaetes bacterium GWE1_32_154]OHD50106.1 MAG: hypothetical protein A2Y29_12230 [Spirochaetes bacterium GWE2_31_10]OHD52419.1 MAG: hypothetical protein A2015_16820 [Spirochaetes bacterium GWF1_31_7]OHD73783.1 MAG: hypothetical protein A2355_10680 [Spirochaetes bacterium RIFOXYB1_FULL_32_8]HBD96063.1 hypothetical protein [Spirochaetia bacterium]
MIVKMKKMTLLIYHSSKDAFLADLQNLGVVHLETNRSASSDKIVRCKDFINRLGNSYKILKPYEDLKTDFNPGYSINDSVEILLEKVERDKGIYDNALSERETLKKDLSQAIPFGTFIKESVSKLNEIGVHFKVFSATKSAYAKIQHTNIVCEEIYTDKSTVYYAVFFKNGEILPELPGIEEKLPKLNITELQEKITEFDIVIKECEEKFIFCARFISLIEQKVKEEYNNLHYAFADASLSPEVDGKVFIINGFIPNKIEKQVDLFLKSQDCAYIIEDPKPDDNVPIRLKNNSFAKLFEPIGQLFSLPDYGELDTVPFFAPFFALFFGLCLGDIGYGFIILVLVVIGLFTVKNKGIKKILYLGLVLGLFTVLGGFILNTFFGNAIVEKTAYGNVETKIGVFDSLKNLVTFSDPNDRKGPMIFAILLGIIQVLLGQTLNAYNRVKNLGIQGIFQPIGTGMILIGSVMMIMIWMYKPSPEHSLTNFLVGPIPIGDMLASVGDPYKVGSYIALSGIGLILLFNSIGSGSFFLRPLKGLWELYNVFTGLLGDILSYIRIFALGLAGGLLGAAFNGIALSLKELPGGIFFMILIMVLGHTLNFLLASLGAFVHPLRLTFVEFYKAVGFTGGGKPYTPFTNKTVEK